MAWRFAVASPERIAKLVLISPASYPNSIVVLAGMKAPTSLWGKFLAMHVLTKAQIRKGLEATVSRPSKITDEEVERSFDLSRRKGNRVALGQTMRVSMGEAEPDTINRVKSPTLILWGTDDKVIPAVPYAEQFHKRTVNSTLVMLPGVGHISQEEDAAGTLAAFNGWLDRPKR